MCVLHVCIYAHVHVVPMDVRREHPILSNCKMAMSECWKWDPGPLQEQSLLLTTEPSLQALSLPSSLCYFEGLHYREFLRSVPETGRGREGTRSDNVGQRGNWAVILL